MELLLNAGFFLLDFVIQALVIIFGTGGNEDGR